MRIAFHTPLNPLDGGTASGDRRMARQLVAVLEDLGHEVVPIMAPRTYLHEPDPEAFARHEAEAAALARSLLAEWRGGPGRPALWFTYHSYYRAPDLLGPVLSEELGIPYVLAEASEAAGRAAGPWASRVVHARTAIAAADLNLCFTARDRAGIAPLCKPGSALVDLPPFLAGAASGDAAIREPGAALRLITTAMMRPGKLASYRCLAATLHRLGDRPWTLSLFGDGPMRPQVEALLADLPPGRIAWRGLAPNETVREAFAAHDVFFWPGVREAYGLVYLEAQAAGLPVVACDSGGVSATVRDGETAILVPEADAEALAAALARLADDPGLRLRMGRAAARFVATERTPQQAAAIIGPALAALTALPAASARASA